MASPQVSRDLQRLISLLQSCVYVLKVQQHTGQNTLGFHDQRPTSDKSCAQLELVAIALPKHVLYLWQAAQLEAYNQYSSGHMLALSSWELNVSAHRLGMMLVLSLPAFEIIEEDFAMQALHKDCSTSSVDSAGHGQCQHLSHLWARQSSRLQDTTSQLSEASEKTFKHAGDPHMRTAGPSTRCGLQSQHHDMIILQAMSLCGQHTCIRSHYIYKNVRGHRLVASAYQLISRMHRQSNCTCNKQGADALKALPSDMQPQKSFLHAYTSYDWQAFHATQHNCMTTHRQRDRQVNC